MATSLQLLLIHEHPKRIPFQLALTLVGSGGCETNGIVQWLTVRLSSSFKSMAKTLQRSPPKKNWIETSDIFDLVWPQRPKSLLHEVSVDPITAGSNISKELKTSQIDDYDEEAQRILEDPKASQCLWMATIRNHSAKLAFVLVQVFRSMAATNSWTKDKLTKRIAHRRIPSTLRSIHHNDNADG